MPEESVNMLKNLVNKPELCKFYLEKLNSLPDYIKSSELNKIVENILLSPYTLALREMENVLSTSNIILNRSKNERVKSLLQKGADLRRYKTLNYREPETPYRIKVTKPGTNLDNLLDDLAKVNTCQISESNRYLYDAKLIADWLRKDIDIGACIMLFGEEYNYKQRIPKVMTRCYVGLNKKGEHILFLDAIESGDIKWDEVSQWMTNKRGQELLYAIAAANYIAIEYGIKKLVLGEREAEELSNMLGYTEEEVFDNFSSPIERGTDKYSGERKIGYFGQPYNATLGPYAYMLYRDSKRRVINVSKIQNYSTNYLEEILDNIKKTLIPKMRKNKNKMDELSLYASIINAMNKLSKYSSETIRKKIDLLAKKGIELYIVKNQEELLGGWAKEKKLAVRFK